MKKLVLLTMIVLIAIPCFGVSPYNIWTKPTSDWLTGQTPNFDPAWAWMKWMDGQCSVSAGTAYYVDIDSGADTNTGLTWARAFKTIQVAADAVDDFDTIYVMSTSTITETVTTSSADIGVRLIGVAIGKTNPNWQSSGTGTNTLIINGPNTEVRNFLFTGATRTVPYIRVNFTANGTTIQNCYFHGNNDSQSAIQFYGAPPQCRLYNNHITAFGGAMAADIAAVWGQYGSMSANDYEICGNWFTNNTDHIDLASNNTLYQGNHFNTDGETDDAATIIDTYGSGADTGFNTIVGNYFGDTSADMTVAAGYTFVSTDMVSGNYCTDGIYPKTGQEGNVYYVDNVTGNAANSGLSWGQAMATIAQGVALMTAANSTLYVGGTAYTENVITPTGVSGGKILAVSNSRGTPLWQASTTGNIHLTIISPEWEVAGFRFHGSTNTVPYVRVHSNVGSSYNAHAAVIRDCWFSGDTAFAGIEYVGGPTSCKILRNKFTGFTTGDALWEGAVSGNDYVQAAVLFEIIDNHFANNVKNLNLMLNASLIKGNSFTTATGSAATTMVLNTSPGGGGGGGNVVTENYFPHLSYQIDVAHGYSGPATDNWVGNFCSDSLTIETYPGAGAATTEVNGVRSVPHTTMTITGTMTDTSYGDDDDPVIFTVTGDIICRAFAIVNAEVITNNNDGSLELGVTGDTACLLASDVADNSEFQINDCWTLDQVPETPSAELNDSWVVIPNGLDIMLFIGTNHCTAGVVTFYLEWIPMSADAEVVGAAP